MDTLYLSNARCLVIRDLEEKCYESHEVEGWVNDRHIRNFFQTHSTTLFRFDLNHNCLFVFQWWECWDLHPQSQMLIDLGKGSGRNLAFQSITKKEIRKCNIIWSVIFRLSANSIVKTQLKLNLAMSDRTAFPGWFPLRIFHIMVMTRRERWKETPNQTWIIERSRDSRDPGRILQHIWSKPYSLASAKFSLP
jgi:hypothetical protein